jgi:hypothetical protein
MIKRPSTQPVGAKLKDTPKVQKKVSSVGVNRIANLGDYAHPPKSKKKKT